MTRFALVAAAFVLAGTPARAGEPEHRLVDVGARLGYARPLGAFDAATRATDMSHGGVPVALDGTLRLGPASAWNVYAGALVSWAETIPRLCGSASECIGSLGHDVDLTVLARLRGPRLGIVLPEAEIGTGYSWSSRSLVDRDATSTRSWRGPLLVRGAIVPSLALGARARLGLAVGGSLGRSTAFHLEAPGLDQRTLAGARLHGTFDVAVRFAVGLAE